MKQDKKPIWTTPHGTKYYFIDEKNDEFGTVRVQVDFLVNLKRLLLFEEFCDVTGKFFPIVVTDAIREKMDNEIRNSNAEKIGNYVKEEYLKKWDSNANRTYRVNLQEAVNES